MDNVDTQDVPMDNVDTQPQDAGIVTDTDSFRWKENIPSDLANSPFVADDRFGNDSAGLSKLIESYGNLEKLLGHEKIPVPKGEDDTEGWNRYAKAFGIPDKAEGYGLPDAQLPESMQGQALDKNQFAELAHAHKLTPAQTKGLWESYTQLNVEAFNKALQGQETKMEETISRLKGEWGDTYDTNVELGQMVINKFSDDQEMNDFITATLAADPRGAKFLAKLGNEFAENKIGTFDVKRFSLAPEQAEDEIQKITMDPNHPYNNPSAPDNEHQAAVDYVNSLYATINRAKGQVA